MDIHSISAGWWNSLKIHEYGFESNATGQTRLHAGRDRYSLFYILDGAGKLLMEEQAVDISNDSLFFLSAEDSAALVWNTDACGEFVFVSFSCDCKPDFIKNTASHNASLKQIFLTIKNHIHDSGFDGKIYALIYELFWQLSQDNAPPLSGDWGYASYAKSYLDSYYMTQVQIQLVAGQLHIDRRYLTSLFRKEYGITPHAYLMSLRLNKAKELLLSGHSVTEAASMAGFTDLPNFSRQYRARFGISPGTQRTAIPENSP